MKSILIHKLGERSMCWQYPAITFIKRWNNFSNTELSSRVKCLALPSAGGERGDGRGGTCAIYSGFVSYEVGDLEQIMSLLVF